MAIVRMSSFELIVMKRDQDRILLALQGFSNLSFMKPKANQEGFIPYHNDYDFDENLRKQNYIKEVLGAMKSSGLKDIGLKEKNFYELYEEKIENLDYLLELYNENYDSKDHVLKDYIHRIPWQDQNYELDQLYALRDTKIWAGTVAKDKEKDLIGALKKHPNWYYCITEAEGKSTLLLYAPQEEHDECDIFVVKHGLKRRSIVSLGLEELEASMEKILAALIRKKEEIKKRQVSVAEDKEVLEIHYERLVSEYAREEVKMKALVSKQTVLLSGWIFHDQEESFKERILKLSEGRASIKIEDAMHHDKEVPVVLKNNLLVAAFEPITTMYALPRYDELDPTPLFAPFYAMFFGMMLADLGYGLLMSITMFTILKLFTLRPDMEKMIRLLAIVGLSTMLWGLIYGSFFGGIIPMTALIDINRDFTMVLVLSMALGIFHLFCGLAIKAYIYVRDYKKRYVIYDVIFWYFLLGGAIVLVSQMFTDFLASYQQIAWIFFLAGALGIVLTNGRDAKTIGGKLASGLYSLYGLTNYVGDVVSYSRLMALGLAGASIGMAFNMMVGMISAGGGIFGIFFAAFVFMFGHTFNLLINGLSAYVHAARLTYVEFFSKFYAGGGKAFAPFRPKPTYLILKEEE